MHTVTHISKAYTNPVKATVDAKGHHKCQGQQRSASNDVSSKNKSRWSIALK